MEQFIAICAVCFLIGMLFDEFVRHVQKSYGTLKIDHTNPEKDVYRLELDELDNLTKKKFVVLKVDNDADLSQK